MQYLYFVDRLSMFTGKAFAWCIIILTLGGSYEVFVRYLLNSPTGWAYDMSYIMYGALFLMAGPYALSRDGHEATSSIGCSRSACRPASTWCCT